MSVKHVVGVMREAVVFDPGRFLDKSLGNDERIRYFCDREAGWKKSEWHVHEQLMASGAMMLAGKLEQAADPLRAEAQAGVRIASMPADVSSQAEVQRLVEAAERELGGVDVLVANAGVYGPKGSIGKVDWDSIAPGALNTRLPDEVLAAGPDQVGDAFYKASVKQQQSGGTPLEKGADLIVPAGRGLPWGK